MFSRPRGGEGDVLIQLRGWPQLGRVFEPTIRLWFSTEFYQYAVSTVALRIHQPSTRAPCWLCLEQQTIGWFPTLYLHWPRRTTRSGSTLFSCLSRNLMSWTAISPRPSIGGTSSLIRRAVLFPVWSWACIWNPTRWNPMLPTSFSSEWWRWRWHVPHDSLRCFDSIV